MKPDLTSSDPGRRPSSREEIGAAGKAHLTLVNQSPWTHTLVLTGELNVRSAPALEEEIEGLFQEGVAALRLDLRQLERIDGVGIAVIAFRSQECVRLGCAFDVLVDSPALRLALSDAGVALAVEGTAGVPKLALCTEESAGANAPERDTETRQARLVRFARWLPGD